MLAVTGLSPRESPSVRDPREEATAVRDRRTLAPSREAPELRTPAARAPVAGLRTHGRRARSYWPSLPGIAPSAR
ncbi:hypothetical protein GCM10009613_21210 [Pseudonocardia kongjuensis]|uniref:Uncharacterized protein n=1 Tax=Pseudonocardia kongjuensis TaxID=102227 RepID=A0ABP4IGC1_9PSEU